MNEQSQVNQDNFLYPHYTYRGKFKPNQRISYISNLNTAGKLSPQEAYQQVSELWQCLESSKNKLLERVEPESNPNS